MGTKNIAWLGLVAVLVFGGVACSDDSGDSAKSTTTTEATTTTVAATTTTAAATTTTAGPTGVAAGTYLNGGTGDPHYSLVMQTSNGDGIGGSLSYVFQDGTTNELFTFSGSASGGNGNATSTSGAAFTFTYTANQVVIADCGAFMTNPPTTCTFTLQ